ncbi:MAG: ATP-binding protein [Candidatus Aenigmatarchaeota archaeon]
MPIETNWYVITGGPSSGKTKTLEHLGFLGYRFVPEAARVLIDAERSKGRYVSEIRADESEFQRRVLQMKIDVEDRTPEDQMTFFERGIPDTIAYCRALGFDADCAAAVSAKRRYIGVFLFDRLVFRRDYARTENRKFSNKLELFLYDVYTELGYDVVHVPAMPIDERAEFILNKINMYRKV